MFLKRIEMQGFKSFADRTVITFEQDITGIVGPNGCGKSNISDAIRWVLGEQSAKSLRGKSMTDVIFNGSKDRRSVNFAEVVLVFDNHSHFLQTDYEEVEITRRLHRISGESEYLINRQPCRLKDIIDLVLDSGLSRDSLSIISQGTIANFADARPEDRRGLFEEAAGVAKYKKRKHESTLKLERTQLNLDRVQDIVDELEKQVTPLRRQANKARLYRQKKAELEKIEIAVLVSEIQNGQRLIEEANEELQRVEAKALTHTIQIQNLESATAELKDEIRTLDREVNDAQDRILQWMQEIGRLEARRVELDEKRKYQIQMGQDEAKRQETLAMLQEAKFEYEDRARRQATLQAELQLLQQNYETAASQASQHQQQLDEALRLVRQLENRQALLQAQLQRPYQHQAGVQAINEAKDSLPGILDVVGHALQPANGYEEAISTALGGAVYHIITHDEASARRAIQFLKRNRSGRATFLPLSVMRARTVHPDAQIICDHAEGYLGNGAEFVSYDALYENLVLNLLGNVLVCDTLEHANALASLLKFNYMLVTLDGDVVHRGGSMTGGSHKESYSLLTLEKEASKVVEQLETAKQALLNAQVANTASIRSREQIDEQMLQTRIQLAQLEPVLEAKRSKAERLQMEYEAMDPQHIAEHVSFADDLLRSLNDAYQAKDELTTTIRLKRDRRMKSNADWERKESQIRQIRQDLATVQQAQNRLEKEKIRVQSQLEAQVTRLHTEYQMTVEFAKQQPADLDVTEAKQRVLELRAEIADLGNINMEAPEQFDEVNERYEFLSSQRDQLLEGKNKILNAIAEMDEVMETQFIDMFHRINEELQQVFAVLFGGGRAKLLLENPDDILGSGIEIDVQPPGKNVQNIRLFSGGEKSLIAICVLFAILKARPLPLCIFDEVEAALDPGNVERFASFLHQFTETSQFIVVTHRQGTMEHCDVLYGVTMPQQGISQILKVRLSDAIDYSEENKEDNA